MEKSGDQGMQTFDTALFKQGRISIEEALKNADSKNNLRLKLTLDEKPGAKKKAADSAAAKNAAALSAARKHQAAAAVESESEPEEKSGLEGASLEAPVAHADGRSGRQTRGFLTRGQALSPRWPRPPWAGSGHPHLMPSTG